MVLTLRRAVVGWQIPAGQPIRDMTSESLKEMGTGTHEQRNGGLVSDPWTVLLMIYNIECTIVSTVINNSL